MNKFYIVASTLVVALVFVGLASANGGRSEEGEEENRCSLRQISDELLLEEIGRRGHLRRPQHGNRPLRPRLGLGAGAGVGAGLGVSASRERFGGVGSSDRQNSHASVENQRGSSHSSRFGGELEGHNNDFDDTQGISKHTEQSSSTNDLLHKGKSQSSTEIDGFRRTRGHNRGGNLRGEFNRNDNENSSNRIEVGQDSERRQGAVGGSSSSLDVGAGIGAGIGGGVGVGVGAEE